MGWGKLKKLSHPKLQTFFNEFFSRPTAIPKVDVQNVLVSLEKIGLRLVTLVCP